jgi:hypothetical protein
VLAFLWTAALLMITGCVPRSRVNRRALMWAEFEKRVEQYLELHQRLETTVPERSVRASAEEISAYRSALAAAIRMARSEARHGDIFPPAAANAIREVVRTAVLGPNGDEIRAALRQGNPEVVPSVPVQIGVNAFYPVAAPLSTMPYQLLVNLPRLPQQLEYRFVGRDLVLFDVAASLIVDYIRNATPRL